MSAVDELNQQITDLQKQRQAAIDERAAKYREEFESLKWLDGLKCNFRQSLNPYCGTEYVLTLWERPKLLEQVREVSWSRGISLAGSSPHYLMNVMLRMTFTMGEAPEIYSSNPALLAQFIRDHKLVISKPSNAEGTLDLWKAVIEHAE